MKQIITTTALILSATAALTGCAEQQQAQQVTVSPEEFKDYNCKQISKEMKYTSSKIEAATQSNQQNELLNTALTAYMVSQRYAFRKNRSEDPQVTYLKAKYEALHQASIKKNCD